MSASSAPDPSAQPATGSASAAPAAKGVKRAAAATLVGAVLTAAIATSVLLPHGASNAGAEERAEAVPLSQLDAAAQTLNAQARGGLLAAARSCQAPLVMMTLTKTPGAAGGLIRIRSGTYVSPQFQLSDTPQRIAVPFPAPYAARRGQMWVEGVASGVELTLFPTWTAPNLSGSGLINLIWDADKACAS